MCTEFSFQYLVIRFELAVARKTLGNGRLFFLINKERGHDHITPS
jgi:hypothetical protein